MQTVKCFNNHMGPWAIRSDFMSQTLRAIKDGILQPRAQANESKPAQPLLYQKSGKVAVIGMTGPMMKGYSKFMDNCSTVETRQAIRQALADDSVYEICLVIDSPGGTVAGTAELAADIALANEKKKVTAQVLDECASAAYWCASQCSKVYSNSTALVGCIGTILTLVDTSKQAELQGVKVHVISTGQFKGAFEDGTEITDEQKQYAQSLVDGLNVHFQSAVKTGRGFNKESLAAVSDGRIFVADEAQKLGLVDGIQSLEDTLAQMNRRVKNKSDAKKMMYNSTVSGF